MVNFSATGKGLSRDVVLASLLALVLAMGTLALSLTTTGDNSQGGQLQMDMPLFSVSYLFLLGVTQSGIVFCAIARLVYAQWAKPFYRIAELSTMAFAPLAFIGLLVIYFAGGDQMFYWLSIVPEPHLSPWLDGDLLLGRNLLGLIFFYTVGAIYTMTALRPDLGRGSASIDGDAAARQLYLLSPLVIISFVVCNTLLAWDFAMMLIPHWHSTVFPIYYWFGNLFAGTAALIAIPVCLSRNAAVTPRFGSAQIRGLGMLVTAFTLMWLYFYWAQFFVIWFGNLPREADPLWRQMYGHYQPFYWIMMAGCFFLPFACLLFAVVKRSLLAMCIIAAAVNLGIWSSRYLMVVPALSPDHRPFDTWLDIILAVDLLAGFLIILVILASRLPQYSLWEMRRTADSEK